MRLVEIIHHGLRWHAIAPIANNEISKLVGLVPIVGYVILYNDFVIEKMSFKELLGSQSDLNLFLFSALSKLHLTFFGSLLVFISNFTFKIACPKVIRNHPSGLDFSDHVLNSYSVLEIQRLEKKVRGLAEFKTPFVEEYTSKPGLSKNHLAAYTKKHPMIEEHRDYVSALSREWWSQSDYRFPCIRKTCLFCGIIGYFMLSLPTLDIAQAVIRNFSTIL